MRLLHAGPGTQAQHHLTHVGMSDEPLGELPWNAKTRNARILHAYRRNLSKKHAFLRTLKRNEKINYYVHAFSFIWSRRHSQRSRGEVG